MWLGSASGTFDAYFRATFIPKTETLNCSPWPCSRWHQKERITITTNNHIIWKTQCRVVTEIRRVAAKQRWIERKTPSSLATLPKRLRLGRTMMHLFGEARSIHRGESWKIPLSFHPTQSECIYTTPRRPCAGRPRQRNLSQTEGTPEEQRGAEGQLSHPARGTPSLSLSLGFDPLR